MPCILGLQGAHTNRLGIRELEAYGTTTAAELDRQIRESSRKKGPDVRTKYLSAKVMVEADHQRLKRTQQLVEIGAASRQELEEATAVHTGHATEAEAARERLVLLGLCRKQVEAMKSASHVISHVVVSTPMDGVITERAANPGQVVAMGGALFVVTDLSEAWAVGDLYEQDFPQVRVGSEATLTTLAYPRLIRWGRVLYIDPRVDPRPARQGCERRSPIPRAASGSACM